MKRDFDFNEVGKRMPYSVDAAFFEEARRRGRAAAAGRKTVRFKAIFAAAAAAAVIAACAVLVRAGSAQRYETADPMLRYEMMLSEASNDTLAELAADYMDYTEEYSTDL